MSTLKTTVIGTGGRSKAHFRVIPILHDKYSLVAVCDIDEEKAKSVAQEMNVKAYTDIEQMIDGEKPDVCLIATQAESHHVIAQFLADRKVNIITETPVALTAQCAHSMIKSAAENSVLLAVSENARRWPRERLKRKIMESGIMGDIRSFYLSYTSGSYHGLAAVRQILGAPAKSVIAEFPAEEGIRERADIEWCEGISGRYEFNKSKGNYWEIKGSEGELRGIELHTYKDNKTLKITTETSGEGDRKTIKRAYVQTDPELAWESHLSRYPLPNDDDVAVADAWCSLYNGVVHDEELDYDGENAKNDVELLIAIRQSASKDGEKVELPLTEITQHERHIHSEFQEFYGIDMLDMRLEHLKRRYTLPDRLRELMYYGKISSK
jgi:predicted dehydrogenase